MTKRVTVTALKALEYEGREYLAGESFQAKPIDAAALSYQRKVSLTRPSRTLRTQTLTPDPIVAPPEARRGRGRPRKTESELSKRTYRRRDLTAEPVE